MNKKYFLLLSTILLATMPACADYVNVTDKLNVRASAQLNSKIIDTLPRNHYVAVQYKNDDWAYIEYYSKQKYKYGWVKKEYLQPEYMSINLKKKAPQQTQAKLSNNEFVKYCATGSYESINKLINRGADVNAKANFPFYENSKLPINSTPLWAAIIENPDDNVIKLLISKGAVVNDNMLISAISYKRNLDVIKTLVENGANVNTHAGIMYEQSPLIMSFFYTEAKQQALIEYLLSKGADINYVDRFGSILSYLIYDKANYALIKMLIDNGASISIKNDDGFLLLSKAIRCSKPEIFDLLISKGANIHSKNQYKQTLAEDTITDITPQMLDKLVSAGYKFATPTDSIKELDKLLLEAAVHNKNPEILQKLINLGADVNIERYTPEYPLKNVNGYCNYQWTNSPLISAVKYAHFSPSVSIQKINILLSNGASITPVQKYGYYCPTPRNGVYVSPASVIEIAQQELIEAINSQSSYYYSNATKEQIIKLYTEIIDLLQKSQ